MSFNAQAYGGGTFGSHLFSFVLLTTKYSRYDTTASSDNTYHTTLPTIT